MRLLAILFVVVAACGAPANTEFIPVGSRCVNNSDCGTAPYDCNLTWPGGYCERSCTLEADCPADAHCVGGHCLRACLYSNDPDCRLSEGYVCGIVPGGFYVCQLPP